MPKEFEECVRRGGRVRTKVIKGGKYVHLCFIEGKVYHGEVKTKKKRSK